MHLYGIHTKSTRNPYMYQYETHTKSAQNTYIHLYGTHTKSVHVPIYGTHTKPVINPYGIHTEVVQNKYRLHIYTYSSYTIETRTRTAVNKTYFIYQNIIPSWLNKVHIINGTNDNRKAHRERIEVVNLEYYFLKHKNVDI